MSFAAKGKKKSSNRIKDKQVGLPHNCPTKTISKNHDLPLKLNDRNRHQGGEVGCKLCSANIENLEHFLQECEKLGEERRRIVELQQPYEENRKKIMGIVLFREEGIEKRKEKIYHMWMCRYVNKSLHVRYDTFGLSTIAQEILGVWGRLALWEKCRQQLRTCQSIDTGCIGS